MATVLYTNRCNFRCPFCHNRQLVLGQDTTLLTKEKVFEILVSRHSFIDGVVITGGEPTIHPGLHELLASLKRTGFTLKLDTNGYRPDVLKLLLTAKVIDYVAMDIKTSWKKYNQATGVKVDIDHLVESIDLIKKSDVEYEFRTTCVPSLVDSEDIEEISKLVGPSGQFTLQQFQSENTLDINYSGIIPYSRDKLINFLEIARQHTSSCSLIGL